MQHIGNYRTFTPVVLIGIALGVFTALGEKFLPRELSLLASSYSIWILCAFIASLLASTKEQSLIYGATTSLVAFITSCLVSVLAFGGGRVAILLAASMLLITILTGPVLAYLAPLWKRGEEKARIIVPVLVGSVFVSQGIGQIISVYSNAIGYVFIGLGLIAFMLLQSYKKVNRPLLLLPMIGAIAPLAMLLYILYIMAFVVLYGFVLWSAAA